MGQCILKDKSLKKSINKSHIIMHQYPHLNKRLINKKLKFDFTINNFKGKNLG